MDYNTDEHTTGNVTPTRTPYRLVIFLPLAIIALQILIALVSYPFLPDQVPSHWNAAGQITSYEPKWIAAILFPLISTGFFLLLYIITIINPKQSRRSIRLSHQANERILNLTLVGVLLLNLVIQLVILAATFKAPVDIELVVSLSVSVLLIFLGNFIGKLRRNRWAGIRTPWTMANETVWERTHRLGGWLFVAGGLLGIVLSFIPPLQLYSVVSIVIAISIICIIYSYVVYQRMVVAGGGNEDRPLTPPGDAEDRI
jgi:uncharacterized membrane protein